MIEKFQQSLARKISLIISLVLILIFTALASYFYEFANEELKKNTLEKTELRARLIADEVSNIFENAAIITDQIGNHSEIKKFLFTADSKKTLSENIYIDSVQKTLIEIQSSDPLLFTSWVGNEKANFYYDNFGVIPDDSYDVRKRPWYPIAISSENVGFTPPYIEWGTGKIVICSVKALRENGSIYGFTGVEIVLDKIPEIFGAHKLGNNDINFLISEDGKYIYNEDASKIMTEGILNDSDPLRAYSEEIFGETEKLLPIDYRGAQYFMLSYPVGNSDWRVVSLINQSEMEKDIKDVLLVIIGLFILTVLFAILVIHFVVTKSIRPYKILVDFAKDIANGDFSRNVPQKYIDRKDEMGKMSHSFQTIIDAFRNENETLERHIREKDFELESQYRYIIESEKATSLGNLVAGVAHEINTPLGICVSVTSYMDNLNQDISKRFSEDKISKNALSTYIENNTEALQLLTHNISRAADLVSSFKQVAVNQSVEIRTTFDLRENISVIITSLKHEYKSKNIEITNNCPADLVINSYPGSYFQIFTNLIMNSVHHGFVDRDGGHIEIDVEDRPDMVIIFYKDDGNGITEENLTQIFEPFFTTKRSSGNVGLGMHIIFNIINQLLKGHIYCKSTLGKGVTFTIELPKAF